MTNKERVDKHLLNLNQSLSRNSIIQLIKKGNLSVNGKIVKKAGTLIDPNLDKLELKFPRVSNKTNIKILFEDNDVIVINKPAGVLSHSKGAIQLENTVADFIRPKINYPNLNNRSGIVHRLDRDTSGVMICAKNEASRLWLTKQFASRKVIKTYYGICQGHFEQKEALIDLAIARNPKKPQTFRVDPGGKSAQTYYKVIKESKKYSLVMLQPKTGRTHQLRVHLAYLNHPLLGDRLYSRTKSDRMFLDAKSLEIRINKNSEMFLFDSILPKIFNQVLENDQ